MRSDVDFTDHFDFETYAVLLIEIERNLATKLQIRVKTKFQAKPASLNILDFFKNIYIKWH